MKVLWVLLCVLETARAAWLPHPDNPSLWGAEGNGLSTGMHNPGANPARLGNANALALQWSEPFPGYSILGAAGEWSSPRFRTAAALSWTALDSLYREFEIGGALSTRLRPAWISGVGYAFSTAWVPEKTVWYRQSLSWGNSVSLGDVLTLSGVAQLAKKEYHFLSYSGDLGVQLFPHPAYSIFCAVPVRHPENATRFQLGQSVNLGGIAFHNAFSWPGPVLGFGIQAGPSSWQAGAGHTRPSATTHHTGLFFLLKSFHDTSHP